jgi:Fe2+ transport system protein FeoA
MSIVVDKGNSDSVPPTNAVRGVPLGLARRGFCGRIHAIHVGDGAHGLSAIELERRLLELGFVEAAQFAAEHKMEQLLLRAVGHCQILSIERNSVTRH